MKAQKLCRRAFFDLFQPVLSEQFPDVLFRLSAGVVGGGSDSLGADDELSRDHDWGLGHCRLLLPDPDVSEYGKAIETALAAAVPDEYLGFPREILRPEAIRVTTIDDVYRGTCNLAHPPDTLRGWAEVDGSALGMAGYGLVIYDPTGALSERKREFETAYFPEDVWKWKMAHMLWEIWQFGEYNGISRLARRGDGVGLLVAQGHFVESVMRLVCVLNKRFSLYYKWLHWQFVQMPRWSDVFEPLLQELEASRDHSQRARHMNDICGKIREALQAGGLLPDAEPRPRMGAWDLLRTIRSEEVRRLIVELDPTLAGERRRWWPDRSRG